MIKDPYKQRVKDVMSKDVVAIDAIDTVHEALVRMVENRVSALPVIDSRSVCVGVISATDLIELTRELDEEFGGLERIGQVSHQWFLDTLVERDMDRRKVEELMTSNVATTAPDAPLVDAAREMLRQHVHRLPVVDANGRLVGIISTMDVLKAFANGAPQ